MQGYCSDWETGAEVGSSKVSPMGLAPSGVATAVLNISTQTINNNRTRMSIFFLSTPSLRTGFCIWRRLPAKEDILG
jgi:hypothetical protein